MTSIRSHLDALAEADDLAIIDERTHWADAAFAVGAEAARGNGPAVLCTDVGGTARLLAGGYGGPDRLGVRSHDPWSRVGAALGLGYDAEYLDVLDTLVAARRGGGAPERAPPVADVETDLRSLGLPAVAGTSDPTVPLGIGVRETAGVSGDAEGDAGAVEWFPVGGTVEGSDGLRLSIPTAVIADTEPGAALSLALGVPPAALIAVGVHWVGDARVSAPPEIANALNGVPVAPTAGGSLPAESEVLVDATVTATDDVSPAPETQRTPWQAAVETASATARVDSVVARENPVVPFSPTGAPMSDGRVLVSLVESARLYGRVNNYWGVAPVEWLALPAEAGLGICLVASDILYTGFEWQLANTLFSFSRLFDKVIVLDTETPPMDLAHAFDDVWVKAHPANDWEFSDSAAPAATTTHYRRDEATGANVYVDAAWDPRWDEEYIAPRVTFDLTYPADLRAAVRADWVEMGFDHGPEHEPRERRRDDEEGRQ